MPKTSHVSIGEMARADFRTSRDADAVNGDLQRRLELQFRYQPARIAIGRSLAVGDAPPALTDVLGKPIRGDILFGQDEADLALWASLVVEHHGASLTRKALQERVGAHWSRGLLLLRGELAGADDEGSTPVSRLVGLVGAR